MVSRKQFPPWLKTVLPYLGLAAAVLVAYAGLYDNPLFYGDFAATVDDRLRHGWPFVPALFTVGDADGLFYRPVQNLLYAAIFQTAGLSQPAFHAASVFLHAVNACLVYRLGQKLGFRPLAAFLAALLWAVHPVQAEAVAYASGASDELFSLFCLIGLVILVPAFTALRLLASIPFMALALLSKETAIIFPLLALGCRLYVQPGKRLDMRAILWLWPLWALAAIYLALRIVIDSQDVYAVLQTANHAPDTGASVPSAYAALGSVPVYLRLLVWPFGLHGEHDLRSYRHFLDIGPLVGIGLILAAAIQILCPQNARTRPVSWGLCWFIVALLPVAAFIPNRQLFDHWLYLPSAGLFLGILESLFRSAEILSAVKAVLLRRIVAGVFAVLIALSIPLTARQVHRWHDPAGFNENSGNHNSAAPGIPRGP